MCYFFLRAVAGFPAFVAVFPGFPCRAGFSAKSAICAAFAFDNVPGFPFADLAFPDEPEGGA